MKTLTVPSSGSVGAVCATRSRGGQAIRARRKPRHQETAAQVSARSRFSRAVAGFGALSDSERLAWSAASQSHPITDALGQSLILTAQQLYVRLASNLALIGASLPTLPPSDWTVPVRSIHFGTTHVGGNVGGAWSAAVPSGYHGVVSMTSPVSSGRRSWDHYRIVGISSPGNTGWGLLLANYSAIFGRPQLGQRLLARAMLVSDAGVAGSPSVATTIVVA